MCRLLIRLTAGILVCFFISTHGGFVQADDFIINYDTAFTIRDNDGNDGLPDGIPDDMDEIPFGRFWGTISKSESLIDEFLLEFDIRNLEPVASAKFYYYFEGAIPIFTADRTIDLTLADYEGDGEAGMDKFGMGLDFAEATISNTQYINSIDVTDIVNSYIKSEATHLGIRLHSPNADPPRTAAQLFFTLGYLHIIPTRELSDVMHPTGAVHAKSGLHWPLYRKKVRVNISGYVVDELSVARDEGGIGVSHAYLQINDRKIVLRDDNIDIIDQDGSFKYCAWIDARRSKVYKIRLYAADTSPEGPNFGLVDSTTVRVPGSIWGVIK